jgi:hypothetical protein
MQIGCDMLRLPTKQETVQVLGNEYNHSKDFGFYYDLEFEVRSESMRDIPITVQLLYGNKHISLISIHGCADASVENPVLILVELVSLST